MKKFKIVTYGCQINVYESERFREAFLSSGFKEVKNEEDADVVLLNSCAVREKSVLKLFSKLGYISKLFRTQGHPAAIVTGCVTTVKQEDIKRIGGKSVIDVFSGIEPLSNRIEKIKKILSLKEKQNALIEKKVFAYVPIIYGCNNFCTYCIVPITKGRERSRTKEEILSEVQMLVKNGTKEIVLLGQNINHYGRDIGYKNGFIEILEAVDKIEGLKRLRYLTPHPADFTVEILQRMRNLKTLCPHFHLPVQSGSDKILKLMKRGYTREEYLALIENVKRLFPEASITTDIIVGFPYETENDYLETKSLVEYVQFDKIFAAAYSPRPNTAASVMPHQIETQEKKRRLNDLLSLANAISAEKNSSYIGKTVEVLIETVKKGEVFGRIPQDKLVITKKDASVGDIIEVTITDADAFHLRGE